MGSRQSLKTYLAVQAVGDAPPVAEEDRRRLKRCRVLASLTFVSLVLGTEFWLLSQQDEKALDIFFRVLFGFVYQMAFMGTLVDVTRAWSWAAFRAPGRVLHFRPAAGTVSFPRVFVSFTLATALNVAAYFDVSTTIGSALAVALLYRTVSQAHRRTFSIRVVSLCMLAWLAITFVLSGIVIAALIQNTKTAENGDLVDQDGNVVIPADPSEAAFASDKVMNYVNLLMPVVYGLFPGILIAGCYRFDYANHVEENSAAASVVTFETVAPRARFAKFLSQGVILPSTVPSRFYKPYYATALRSWFLAQVVTFGLFAAALPLPEGALDCSAFDLLGLSLAIPFMIIGLAITATIRGEFRRLWTYKEVWTPKEGEAAEGGIVLDEENVDHLPSYEADEKAALLAGQQQAEAAPAYDVAVQVDAKN
ncbi:hypothetical protein JCM10213v2_005668 [Rhodosporidiobolus nylandii]